ncbi:hypothetical protein L211DRAFT_473418 [Terfezia boudieri ATCC MYA-4762]|uniref:Uncharacterized protein n=1 Tax=Terfezia boudieri ATCC MYA-4762 TaxID=1051890 RepID=A0A3N4LYE3_9PEZI|nr:hypothetical protein L211DRAFT_473418 [Terfezia boudieri ATCC MYA-4762]
MGELPLKMESRWPGDINAARARKGLHTRGRELNATAPMHISLMKYDDAHYYMNSTLAVSQLCCKYYQVNLFPLSNIFVYLADIRINIPADYFYNPQSPNALKGMDNRKLEGESLEEHPNPLKGCFLRLRWSGRRWGSTSGIQKYYVRFSSAYKLVEAKPSPHDAYVCEQGHGVRKQSRGKYFKSHETLHTNNIQFWKKRHRFMRPNTIGLASVQLLSNYHETGCVSEDATRLSCL